MTTLPISIWANPASAQATVYTMTMPKKGHIVGVLLSATTAGAATECYIQARLSLNNDTTDLAAPSGLQTTSIISGIFGRALPPVAGGSGPTGVSQFVIMRMLVVPNQNLYLQCLVGAGSGLILCTIYLQ